MSPKTRSAVHSANKVRHVQSHDCIRDTILYLMVTCSFTSQRKGMDLTAHALGVFAAARILAERCEQGRETLLPLISTCPGIYTLSCYPILIKCFTHDLAILFAIVQISPSAVSHSSRIPLITPLMHNPDMTFDMTLASHLKACPAS